MTTMSSGASLPCASPTWGVAKLQALLDSPTPSDSPALFAALSSISAFSRTTFSRQGLTSEIERQSIEETRKVLGLFLPTQKAMEGVVNEVNSMREEIDGLLGKLKRAKEGASSVVKTTRELSKALEEANWKSKVVKSFVRVFALSDDERNVLEDGVVSEKYLEALRKLEKIHQNSKLLLRSSNQKLGVDVLSYSATSREACYEILYKFVQSTSASLDADSVPPLLTAAIAALQPRPMLLKYCAEEVASTRRAALVTRFVTALTKGGKGGVPRPIELHAHDPMRYTNDMLAWMHQALASEKELVVRLFGECSELQPTPHPDPDNKEHVEKGIERNSLTDTVKPESIATKVLNTVFDSLIRPFRVRFEQALEPAPPVVVLFKLATLLDFYANLMGKLLGTNGGVVDMLMECNSVAMYGFFSAWKHKMESFRESSPLPSENLMPPPAVSQSMTRLEEILATADTSLATEDARKGQITAVLEVILTPLQSLCEGLARSLGPLERTIYLANCIDAMKAPLRGYAYASERVESLASIADRSIDSYIQLASTAVLQRAGIYERLQQLREFKAKEGEGDNANNREVLSKDSPVLPTADVESLSIAIRNFYAVLFNGKPDSLEAPGVTKISNVRSRNRAKTDVAEEIAKAHDELYDFVKKMPGGERVGMRDPVKVKIVLTGRV